MQKPESKAGNLRIVKKRRGVERAFRWSAIFSAALAAIILCALLSSVLSKGYKSVVATEILLPIEEGQSIRAAIVNDFGATSRKQRREAYKLISDTSQDFTGVSSHWILASSLVDSWRKGNFSKTQNPLSESQIAYLDKLDEEERIRYSFATNFFLNTDSRYPEIAGILGSSLGTLMTLAIAFLVAFPISTMAAIYLAEFAKPSRFMNFVEVNINNLAAVPAVIFGLLGLLILLQGFGLPRSSSLVGGLVLAALVLPLFIIASRSAIEAVPHSLREASYALGASKMQTILHHVLPSALPGILTGTILGMARLMGESAPLLMIGMVAFVADAPTSTLDPATVLPVQIYLWADSPERGFVERTSAAIVVLLLMLIVIILVAQIIRRRFEKRW